jgi:hypothetical protein
MQIDPNKYTSVFEENVRKRFQNIHSVKVRGLKEGFNSDCAVDWPYLGVDYKCNFYVNGEKRLNLFIELEFERELGLRERLEDAISGSKIEKSGMLNRPHREYFDSEKREFHQHHVLEEQKKLSGLSIEERMIGESSIFKKYVDLLFEKGLIRKEKDYYFISCRIKKIPEDPNTLVDNIFGNIIAPIYNTIIHSPKTGNN